MAFNLIMFILKHNETEGKQQMVQKLKAGTRVYQQLSSTTITKVERKREMEKS